MFPTRKEVATVVATYVMTGDIAYPRHSPLGFAVNVHGAEHEPAVREAFGSQLPNGGQRDANFASFVERDANLELREPGPSKSPERSHQYPVIAARAHGPVIAKLRNEGGVKTSTRPHQHPVPPNSQGVRVLFFRKGGAGRNFEALPATPGPTSRALSRTLGDFKVVR